MESKARIKNILKGKTVDRAGFWLGNPAEETKRIYYGHFGIEDDSRQHCPANSAFLKDVRLHSEFNSDLFWASPELDAAAWKHPEGKAVFDVLGGKKRKSLGQKGIFADAKSTDEIEAFDWPNPDYWDFSTTLETIEMAALGGMAVFSGMWMPFFHIVSDFFGMENYFTKMYTEPRVAEAVTEKIVGFYLESNRRFLDIAGTGIDALFFGNDLGSQRDLLISPDCFKKFIMPGLEKIVQQATSYGLPVVLHSCGAISKIIPQLIEIGISALHPIQIKAAGMDAGRLEKEFGKDIVFMGGVDTQHLLPFGTPDEVAAEVRRLKIIFKGHYIVSPSHEALLPNVPVSNAIAMRDAAIK